MIKLVECLDIMDMYWLMNQDHGCLLLAEFRYSGLYFSVADSAFFLSANNPPVIFVITCDYCIIFVQFVSLICKVNAPSKKLDYSVNLTLVYNVLSWL